MESKGRMGSSFDDVLKQEGIYAEVTMRAIKRVIVRQPRCVRRTRPGTQLA
jgi:hypothetical protein